MSSSQIRHVFLASCLSLLLFPTLARGASPETRLGPPPQGEDGWWLRPKASRARGASGLTVNTGSRQAVSDFFSTVYEPAFKVAMGWTGSIGGCVPGTTSAAYRDATLDVINFFRAMSGLPGDVTFDPTFDAKDQEAALMMIAEGALDHFPDPTFACYTTAGAEAAVSSNLALGFAGPLAILAYVNDFGPGNESVGHRRWILYPPQMDMGTGSNDGVNGFDVGSNALWTVANAYGPRPRGPEWVRFPNEGYVPYELLFPPALEGFAANRWSLSYNVDMADYPPGSASVDFSLASVTMTSEGSEIPLVVVSSTDQYGDATLVWEPIGLTFSPGSADLTITVTVTGVDVEGFPSATTYDITLFDPGVAGTSIFEDGFESGNTSRWSLP